MFCAPEAVPRITLNNPKVINASIRIADHLLKTMKETGFLHLRNEAEAIILRAEDVRAFKLTQLTTEG